MKESTPPTAPNPAAATVPDYYRPESYCAEESVGYLMRRVINAMSQAVDVQLYKPDSPTYPQWLPLHKLHMGKAQTVAELARECMLDAGSMTRLLDRLEAKGLCRRVRSVTDRRVVNIELTDEGRSAARQVPEVLCKVQNAYLTGFDPAEWEQLKAYLRRILDNTQAFGAQGAKK
jgi:DNA-binding MarR family transcriptional regulator